MWSLQCGCIPFWCGCIFISLAYTGVFTMVFTVVADDLKFPFSIEYPIKEWRGKRLMRTDVLQISSVKKTELMAGANL